MTGRDNIDDAQQALDALRAELADARELEAAAEREADAAGGEP